MKCTAIKRGLFLVLAMSLLVGLFVQSVDFVSGDVTHYLTVTGETYDGYIWVGNTTYSVAQEATFGTVVLSGNDFYVGQRLYATIYYVFRAFVYFDTSPITSDGTITSAVLSLTVETDLSTTDFNVTIQNGQPSYPSVPLASADYDKTLYNGDGGKTTTTGFSGSVFNITLNADGKGWISKTGITKLCLRSDRDIGEIAPTENGYLKLWSAEKNSTVAPKLYVTYTSEEEVLTITRTFTCGIDDGHTAAEDENYTFVRTTSTAEWVHPDHITVGQWKLGAVYEINRGSVVFDTSTLPDGAIILSSTLSLMVPFGYNNSYTDFDVVIQSGMPIYPHTPLIATDYYYAYYSGDGGSRNTTTIVEEIYWNITLNAEGRSWIQNDGTTKFCLRSSRDINAQAPTGTGNQPHEKVRFYATEWGESYSPKLYVTYQISGYQYVFHGMFSEETGLYVDAVNVTAYYSTSAPETFEVDGIYAYNTSEVPVYFRYELGDKDREYWVGTQTTATIYIFNATLETYTIAFLDLAGVLNSYPYVEAKRYINGSLLTIERRKVDAEKKLQFNLIEGMKYTITIIDGSSYVFGDLLFTEDYAMTLTLKAVDFPKATLFTHKYVRVYGERTFQNPYGILTVMYQDTLNQTYQVDVYLNYKNGTNIQHITFTTSAFTYTYSTSQNDTDYAVVLQIEHQRYGAYLWKQYFPRSFSDAPWGLDWFGSAPFVTAYLIPSLLILFFGGAFTVINAYVGGLVMVIMAAIFTYMGWIAIPAGYLITACAIAILSAIVYMKRRVQT